MQKNSAMLTLPSPLKKAVFSLILFGLSISPALAACHTVTPTGSGSENGTDWNDAYAGLPNTLVRGDIYYLADGNYGHSLSLKQADSGSLTIEIRKAQSYDNCTSTGWDTATMGSSQAVINSGGSGTIVNISSDYWIINGNGNNAGTNEVGCGGVEATPPASMTGAAPNPAACGIKIDDSSCTSTANNGCDGGGGAMHGGGHDITWESVEMKGQGLNSDGNNNSETYFWFATGGNLTNDVITHCWCHNFSTTNFTSVSGGWNNGSFDHNYVWGVFDGSVNHGEAVQLQGSNGTTTPDNIDHNIFRDQQTNGDVVAVIGGTETFNFYDNADICSSGGTSTSCRHNDGVIGCFNSQVCSNVLVYNNTFSFPSDCGFNVSGGASTITYRNNLFYNCGNVTMVNGSGGSASVDYNTYLNSSRSIIGTHDLSVSSGAPNPFSNLAGGSVALASDNADWNNRVSLGSPYDTKDLYGNTFTTDRGAAQYVSSKLGSPINLNGNTAPQ
jgi:hypothetical protein